MFGVFQEQLCRLQGRELGTVWVLCGYWLGIAWVLSPSWNHGLIVWVLSGYCLGIGWVLPGRCVLSGQVS